jgi:hypothetical protein
MLPLLMRHIWRHGTDGTSVSCLLERSSSPLPLQFIRETQSRVEVRRVGNVSQHPIMRQLCCTLHGLSARRQRVGVG